MKSQFCIVISTILFLFLSPCVFGQSDGEFPNGPGYYQAQRSYDVISPEAFKMQEFGYLPDDKLFTGMVPFGIPIYTIKTGGITIPISLNYSTTGLKVIEKSTPIGLGWSLSVPARVILNIKGARSDFSEGIGSKELHEKRVDKGEDEVDCMHDIYTISGGGLNEQFIISNIMEPKMTCYSLTGSTNRITIETGPNREIFGENAASSILKIKVETNDGLLYEFIPTEVGLNEFEDLVPDNHISVWGLSRILDKNTKREVVFEYDNFVFEYERVPTKLSSSNEFLQQLIGSFSKRLVKITWSAGNVLFSYNTKRLDAEGVVKNIYAFTKKEEKAPLYELDEIRVEDFNKNVVRLVSLEQDYFKKNNPQTFYDYRLYLKKLHIKGDFESVGDSYSFEYYSDTMDFPTRKINGTSAMDVFGYFNNKNKQKDLNNSIIWDNVFSKNRKIIGYTAYPRYIEGPKLYRYPRFSTNDILPESHLVCFPFVIPGETWYPPALGETENRQGRDASPTLEACKMGCLKKIVLPTGGYYEFDYELNEFTFKVGPLNEKYDYTRKEAGLRIKSQIKCDGKDINKKSYTYSFDGKTSGFISYYPTFWNSDNTLITPSSSPILQNSSFIGYSKVMVTEEGNGSTIYEYCKPDNLFHDFHIFYLGCPTKECDPKKKSREDNLGIVFPQLSPKIGLLVGKKILSNTGDILSDTKYEYKDFKSGILDTYELNNSKLIMWPNYIVETTFFYNNWYANLSKTIRQEKIEGTSKYRLYQTNYGIDENHNEVTSICTFNPIAVDYIEDPLNDKRFLDLNRTFKLSKKYYTWNVPLNYPMYDNNMKEALALCSSDARSFLLGERHYKGEMNEKSVENLLIADTQNPLDEDLYSNTLFKNKVRLLSDNFNHYRVKEGALVLDKMRQSNYSRTKNQLSNAVQTFNVSDYDNYNRPLKIYGDDNVFYKLKWASNEEVLLSTLKGKQVDCYYFSSFEDEDNTVASVTGGIRMLDNKAYSGTHVLQVDGFCGISMDNPKDLSYQLAFWYKGAGSVVVDGVTYNVDFSDQWRYKSIQITRFLNANIGKLEFVGNMVVDDLRIFPNQTELVTSTYQPLIGTTSITSNSGMVTKYKYDNSGYLSNILDKDGGILTNYIRRLYNDKRSGNNDFYIDTKSIVFEWDDQGITINVYGNEDWSVYNDNSWLSVKKNLNSIFVCCESENYSLDEHRGVITVKSGVKEYVIEVVQKSNFNINKRALSFRWNDKKVEQVDITGGYNWNVVSKPDWIEVIKRPGLLQIRCTSENYGPIEREGTVIIKCGDKEFPITVTQNPDLIIM